HLAHTDGVMLGREAYHNPWILTQVDSEFFGEPAVAISRYDALEAMYPFIEQELARGVYLGHMSRHLLGLFHGVPGGRQFRRYISENAHKPGAGLDVLRVALAKVREIETAIVLTEG
ncbi:MAG TPA: tRNA-dihydrouridine synthase, partial [Marinobacter sp.]|nr:tRNA-dihydrouridine synthase [Marinobacter sp.]